MTTSFTLINNIVANIYTSNKTDIIMMCNLLI